MFKKDQDEHTPSAKSHSIPAVSGRQKPSSHGGGSAVIGQSITVKGDVSGDEDLMIQGCVEGTVKLAQHNVTIGATGKVKADVHGKMVIVEGEVEGDLKAQEQIILRHTARVEGSISAPRVALEDGAVFRGGIEMDSTSKVGKERQPSRIEPAGGSDPGKNQAAGTTSRSGTTGKGLST